MDAANPQQQEQEQERKASMEKTVKVFSSSEDDAESDTGEPVQNHRGWKAMPYVIGEWLPSSALHPASLGSLLQLPCTHMSTANCQA